MNALPVPAGNLPGPQIDTEPSKSRSVRAPWNDEHPFVDSGQSDPFSLEEPGLFACYQAASSGVAVSGQGAGQPALRLLAGSGRAESERPLAERATEPVAEALGVNVYAKQLALSFR